MSPNQSTVVVIGAGISGLAAAIELADHGHSVKLFEKNAGIGGRAGVFEQDGFRFDTGPSWYWMPEVFEKFFNEHGKSCSDYFELQRLDPSYQMIFKDSSIHIPAAFPKTCELFENIEKGSSIFLIQFIREAKYLYETSLHEYLSKPALKLSEFVNWKMFNPTLLLNLITSVESKINRGIKDPRLREILKFPSLFLGAKPSQTPSLYSLMNYADLVGGSWYPKGGMYKLIEAMYTLAIEKGVQFYLNSEIKNIVADSGKIKAVMLQDEVSQRCDAIISTADYYFTEKYLLDSAYQQYTDSYWESRILAPSALIFYIGIKKRLKKLLHHNLFFNSDLKLHLNELYNKKIWPSEPCFYVCVPGITDCSTAPVDCENVFILIPVSAGLQKSDLESHRIFDFAIQQLELHTGQVIRDDIIFKKTKSVSDFQTDYNSFKGTAYGLANTGMQTAFLKPRMRHKKIRGLYFAGQFTHPGPGLPSCLISGQLSAKLLIKDLS